LLFKFHEIEKEDIMFTKKYLAVATLAALAPGMASALTITSTAQTGTVEGLTGVDDIIAGVTLVTSGSPYVVNDVISVTYGSALDEGFSPETTAINCTDTTSGQGHPDDNLFRSAGTMAIQFNSTSTDRKTVDYVVTAFANTPGLGNVDGSSANNALASDGVGMACTVAGAQFNGDDMIAAQNATTGFALPVSGITISSLTSNVKEATTAANVANAFTVNVAPQFDLSAAATEMNASIDVSATPLPRGKFAANGGATIGGGGTTLSSELTIPAQAAGADSFAVSAAIGHSATLTGDFSWMLQTDGTLKTGYSVTATDVGNAAATVTCTTTACSWPVTKADIDGGETYTVAVTTDGATTIPTTTFSQSVAVSYNNVDGQAQTAKIITQAAGSWSINGAGITVHGIPNSTSAELMLHISNRGTQTGAISVALICDSVTTSASFSAGSLISLGSKSISKAVSDAAAADCEDKSRYDAVITINAPLTDVTAVAGYKILQDNGNDRLSLEATQTQSYLKR